MANIIDNDKQVEAILKGLLDYAKDHNLYSFDSNKGTRARGSNKSSIDEINEVNKTLNDTIKRYQDLQDEIKNTNALIEGGIGDLLELNASRIKSEEEAKKIKEEALAEFAKKRTDFDEAYKKADYKNKQTLAANESEYYSNIVNHLRMKEAAQGSLNDLEQEQYNIAIKNLVHTDAITNQLNRNARKNELDSLPLADKQRKIVSDREIRARRQQESDLAKQNELDSISKELSEDEQKAQKKIIAEKYRRINDEDDSLYGTAGGANTSAGDVIKASIDTVADGLGLGELLPMIELFMDVFSGNPLGAAVKILSGIMSLVKSGLNSIADGINKYTEVQDQYMAKINTRLKGTNDYLEDDQDYFSSLSGYFKDLVGSSPYMSQTSLLEKLATLVENGVAYNLEQRTIIAELSDRMVSTFNILEGWIARSTKLQQADISATAIGSESALTEFLNKYFKDNSYMSEAYDSIAEALLEATSQMDVDSATQFQYAVQKWLGALYSLGMSQSGVSTLAQGVAALATGNFDYFNGNDAARVLFASATGGEYGNLLLGGLNASNVDAMMENIVSYLASISQDTNNVTKQVKAGIYGGLSLSDLVAASNLTNAVNLSTMLNESTNWTKSRTTMYSLLNEAQNNTTFKTQLENVIANTIYGIGETIVNENPKGYGIWYLVNKLAGNSSLVSTASNLLITINSWSQLQRDFENAWGSAFTDVKYLRDAKNGGVLAELFQDKYLLNKRGEELTGESWGNGTIVTGISNSANINYGVSTINGSNYTDLSAAESLYANSSVLAASTAAYQDVTSSLVVDIGDLYKALFEDGKEVNVKVSSIDDKAKSTLSDITYKVSDSDTHSLLNSNFISRWVIA